MDENFDPNHAVDVLIEGLDAEEGDTLKGGLQRPNVSDTATADVDTSMISVLGNLIDGKVAVIGDIVAIRAGPDTYHPIKAIKGMASESDVILLSCLPKAPTTPEVTEVVQLALQAVLVRTPSVMSCVNAGLNRGGATGVTPVTAGAMPHLRAMCPSAHAVIVDARLLRAFPSSRARTILAGLSPLPTGAPKLPTVVAGVTGPSGRCFIGQRAGPAGFSAFSIRRLAVETGESLRIDELVAENGGHAQMSARALYDLCGASNGDVLGGCTREGVESRPFARLATEWSYSSDTTRVVGSPPPPACSSVLRVGGACPLTPANMALRDDIEILATAAVAPAVASMVPEAKGPFGREGGGDAHRANDDNEDEEIERNRWEADLDALLSGSENMAELAAKKRNVGLDEEEGNGNDSDGTIGTIEDFTGDFLGADDIDSEGNTRGGSGHQAPRFRGDLDFSEWLWELAARATCPKNVRTALKMVFEAVRKGEIFPVIRRDNQTGVGKHIREGVAMAREVRYRDTISVSTTGSVGSFPSGGRPESDPKMHAWRERGSALLETAESLAEAFVELGVYKITLDVSHWFETQAGVVAADIERALPIPTRDVSSDDSKGKLEETPPRDPRVDRLRTLANALDLVALAKSCGAPWRQIRALAHAALATLGRRTNADGTSCASSPSVVFPLALPKPIPPGARSKLAHPVFWELVLEPATNGSDARGGNESARALETVSYTMATAGLFQLRSVEDPPVLSVGAARAAQAALVSCPSELIPEVLSCIVGAKSFAELKRRQQILRAKGTSAGDNKTAVFVCEHNFMAW